MILDKQPRSYKHAQGRAIAPHRHVVAHAGTVCVLGSADSAGEAALARVVERYAQSTGGYRAQVFSGSSPGATKFGVLRLRRKRAPAASS